ncbi:MAG: Fic family protein [Bacteroidales bacterium]|nr:Fic family protein [Bacteroidales bacterium]
MQENPENIIQLLEKYNKLDIQQAINWEKYNLYSIVHHSTSIEGASLTEIETQLLLDEGITAKGKPLLHHQMQKDHYNALLFVLDSAREKVPFAPDFLKQIAARVMKNTGSIHNTTMGSFDTSKGDFRLLNVYAGETRFVDFSEVPELVEQFCSELNAATSQRLTKEEALILSFDAHFNLVSIHPFEDGNGRVSRLVMNYIQFYHSLPLCNVFKEDKAEYIKALVDTRESNDIEIFRSFMLSQYKKMLDAEISKVINPGKHSPSRTDHKGHNKGLTLFF